MITALVIVAALALCGLVGCLAYMLYDMKKGKK